MSNDALNWAWRAQVGAAKLTLVALADKASSHSHEDWTCFPSVETLMEMTDAGRSTLERHLRWLDKEGWISRRRRVRPDGKLGIFDYTLHRDPELRAELKAERSAGDPPLNMSDGEAVQPPLDLTSATAQIDVQPPLKSSAQEPSVEPSSEPTQSAREPGDEGFEDLEAIWPDEGKARTDWPAARALFARWATELGDWRLLAAVRRYLAEDRDLRRGDHGAPGLHVWLGKERFRVWLGPAKVGVAARPAVAFDGPVELLEAIAGALGGMDAAASCLAKARFDVEARTLTPATGYAAGRLGPLRDLIKGFGVELVERDGSRGSA